MHDWLLEIQLPVDWGFVQAGINLNPKMAATWELIIFLKLQLDSDVYSSVAMYGEFNWQPFSPVFVVRYASWFSLVRSDVGGFFLLEPFCLLFWP